VAAQATATVEREPRSARLRLWLSEQGLVVVLIIAVLLLWQFGTLWLKVPDFVLPTPLAILKKLLLEWHLLLANTWATTEEVLLGFGLSVVVGIPLAIGMVYSRVFDKVAGTFMVSLQTIPKVALAPIFVLWFGYALIPKVLVAFLIAFFPIVVSSTVGLRAVERDMIYLVQSMGATTLQTFVKIRLPRALPSIFGGLKVAIGQAVIGAVVGEFIAAQKGLGYLQLIANVHLDTPLLFAAVAVLSVLGVLLYNLVGLAEHLIIPWHHQITQRTE